MSFGAEESRQRLLPPLAVLVFQDACFATLASGVDGFVKALKGSSDVKQFLYCGGEPRGNECAARHYHGFQGIQVRVINDIAQHIEARLK